MSLGKDQRGTRYHLNDVEIEKSGHEKELGVIICRDLKLKQRCINVHNKANTEYFVVYLGALVPKMLSDIAATNVCNESVRATLL